MEHMKLHAALLALAIFPVFGQAQSRDSLTVVKAGWNVRELAEGVEWKSYHFRDKEKLFGAEEYSTCWSSIRTKPGRPSG